MEIAVFFLEDGAAILLLANSTDGMDIVETISMYLTTICGLCYTLSLLRWIIVKLYLFFVGSLLMFVVMVLMVLVASLSSSLPLSLLVPASSS